MPLSLFCISIFFVKMIRLEPALEGDMEAGKGNHLKKARKQEPRGQEGKHEKEPKPKNFLEVLIQQRKKRARQQNKTSLENNTGKEVLKDKANTPVKVKIQRIEHQSKAKSAQKTPAKRKRGLGGQGRQPSPLSTSKQAKLTIFFGKKSPKAQNTRARMGAQRTTRPESGDRIAIQHTGGLEPPFGRLGWSQRPFF